MVNDFRDIVTMVSIVNGRNEKIFPRELTETLMGLAPAIHGSWNGDTVNAFVRHAVKTFTIEIRRREFLRRPSTGVEPIKLAGPGIPIDEEEVTTNSVHHGFSYAKQGVGSDGCIHCRSAAGEYLGAGLGSQIVTAGNNATVSDDHGPAV